MQPHRFEALGTIWWVTASLTPEVMQSLERIAQQFDRDYSRFSPTSHVGQLNTLRELKNPPQELVAMLHFATEAGRNSDGAFHIGAGGELSKKGYGNQEGDMPSQWWQYVEVSMERIVLQDAMTIDLGGFGKGWLVDRLFTEAIRHTDGEVIINGGGDLRVRQLNAEHFPVTMPHDPSRFFAQVTLQEGAMASSSPVIRSWEHHNHLLGEAGDSIKHDITQVTVTHENAHYADMAATACIVAKDAFAMAEQLGVEILVAREDFTFQATKNFPLLQM